MGQLATVEPGLEVAPERGPAGRPAALLLGTGGREIVDRLQTVGPQMGPVGVGPVHRIAQDHDDPGLGNGLVDPLAWRGVGQVERGRLAPQGAGSGGVEEPLVVVAPPDPLPVAVGVARVRPGSEAARRTGRTWAPSPATGRAGGDGPGRHGGRWCPALGAPMTKKSGRATGPSAGRWPGDARGARLVMCLHEVRSGRVGGRHFYQITCIIKYSGACTRSRTGSGVGDCVAVRAGRGSAGSAARQPSRPAAACGGGRRSPGP